MSRKIRWGIIGLGKIAHKFADDLQRSTDAVLHSVASRSNEKAKAFYEQFGALNYYDSYQALVKDPEVDVVYIATPHSFHHSNTLLCLEHGKAVLCEKPLSVDVDKVSAMLDKATSKKLFLMEAIWTRFMPSIEKLIQLLDSRAIGEVLFMQADFGFKAPADLNGRLYNKRLGGGALLDIGLYPIYLSLLVLGMPNNIKAMARKAPTGVDNYCAMLFDYHDNAKAQLTCTIEADTPTEAVIYGSQGTIKLHSRFHQSEQLSLYKNGTLKEVFTLNFTGNGYVHEIEEVHRCLVQRQLQSKKLPHQMSLDLSEVLERVKEQIGLSYH